MHRDFKGIWIPRDIWLIENLKCTYRVFLAEIDSLDKGQGCYAGNGHFSLMFGLSKNRCSEIITMLWEEKYIIMTHTKAGNKERRILKLNGPFEKSTAPSKNRLDPSAFRLDPSENRQLNIGLEIHLKIQEGTATAWEFLEFTNCIRLEAWLMQNKKAIPDFEDFKKYYNDIVDTEDLLFKERVLYGRLNILATNWKRISKSRAKQDKKQEQINNLYSGEVSKNHPSRKKITYARNQ